MHQKKLNIFQALWYMGRFDNNIGSALLFFPTMMALVWANDGQVSIEQAMIFSLGAIVMRALGCVINDYFDQDIDRQVERTKNRVLTSGRVSNKQVWQIALMLSTIALGLLSRLSLSTQLTGLVGGMGVLLYPLMKRFFPTPQVFLGVCFAWGIVMAYVESGMRSGGIAYFEMMALYVAVIFWIIGFDTIYAVGDKKDDLKLKIHSSAIHWAEKTAWYVASCYGVFICIMAMMGLYKGQGVLFFAAWVYALWDLRRQYQRVFSQKSEGEQSQALSCFKSNGKIALLFFLALCGECMLT